MVNVSIIIPIYNVEAYIERCLRSVMAQTYSKIECILVNDCSPDGSMSVCQKMLADYHGPIRFLTLCHDINRGLSAARNTGTDVATGDYIFYLDSDDEISPDCISLMVNETKKHPNVEIVSGAINPIPYFKQYDSPIYNSHKYLSDNYSIRLLYFSYGWQIYVMAWNKLVKRDFLHTNNIRFVEGILNEDEVWTFETILNCQSLSILPNKTYTHYDTTGSIMNSFNYASRCESICTVLDNIVPMIRQPLANLQTFRYTEYLLLAYYGVQRQRHMVITKNLSHLLVKYCSPFLAMKLFLFLRFNATFHLHKYQNKLAGKFDMVYAKVSYSEQRKLFKVRHNQMQVV